MMKQPLVSIGLPTYNRADDVKVCLANLTSLDYKNIEIIISDNHSTDATAQVCKAYVRKDKRIRYFRQKTNRGVIKNSLFVIKKAKGKYFIWTSDDDRRDRKYLSETIPLLEKNSNATLAITGAKLFTKTHSQVISLYFNTYSRSPIPLLTYLFHPECVSVLLYGVHRLNDELIQRNEILGREFRPFGIMGYDNSFAIYLLLRGDLIYVPKNLFLIRDNGMYLSAYQNLSGANLSKMFFQKAARYSLFPIMFLCDWYYGSLHVYRSSLSFYLKPFLLLSILFKLFLDLILYFFSILKGLSLLVSGILRKIILLLSQVVPFSENK